ncbi:MAG: tetratricopeptide repeat protein [candidate division KSB1 bacterium]|nr:tetratricopeptide repeat protein [candidate division KSB1 bacterium]MDZ7275791.1 tetratricopeptide repeat protein [candidate division KSB1 bacterium]MDZ7287543.1 tetratricopeptide repeat protein [candidate division KSB1 bacterium]MDZ7307969.1 tetratricopeptide repeat protein [candidate division KSB1 bacterium]MDZ7350521.1 tetratricopeptide repeat protein [candidate division KSB1 bacterium]
MKIRFLPAAVVALCHLAGCAYFNTYYNTQRLYKEALEEHKRRPATVDKPTAAEIQKFDKTIEKGSKILQVYPNSKYVDDTLLMLGECFFHKQEYPQALRKFNELITLFPQSELVAPALLWKARTYIEQEDFTNAEAVLKELQNDRKKGDILHRAQYHLGEIYYRQEQYEPAARLFEPAAKRLSDKKLRVAAYLRWGECRFKLKHYHEAAKAYYQAGKQDVDLDVKFNAGLAFARALKADGSYDKALLKLNSMQKEFSTHKNLAWVRFEIAECKLRQGRVEEAEELFALITANDKRTEASAAAYFVLGDLYQRQRHDYARAKEFFDKVRSENSRSEYATAAQQRSKAIDDLLKLNSALSLLRLQQQSPASPAGQPQAERTRESHQSSRASIRRLPTRKLARSSDPAKLRAEMANNQINLAELYYYQFEMPDSAFHIYETVARDYHDTEAAAAALYALALLKAAQDSTGLALRDSLLHVLAEKYPHTRHGREARRRLGVRAAAEQTTSSAREKFQQAESLWLSGGDPQTAIRLLQDLVEQQEDEEIRSKSLFAIGWLYENKLTDNAQAYAAYKQLLEKFPSSSYSNKVRKKVTAFEKQMTGAETTPAPAAGNPAASDSLRARIEQDRQAGPPPQPPTLERKQQRRPPPEVPPPQQQEEEEEEEEEEQNMDDVPPRW